MDKVLRLEEAPPIERLLKRAARQAKLPLKEDSDANSVQPQQPAQQRSASAAPARAGGASNKGKGNGVRSQSVGANRAASTAHRSEGRGGATAASLSKGGSKGKGTNKGAEREEDNESLPTLFQEDWDAKIVEELLPGMAEGLLVAPTMSSAKLLAQRMKGATGKLAMICLDQVDDPHLRQKQVQVSLGVKHGAGRRVQASTAWLVQLGQEDVKLLSAVQTVDIQPKVGQTQVTGVHFEKSEISAELRKSLDAKNAEVAKNYFGAVVDEGARHMLDVFRIKDEGNGYYALLRFPKSAKSELLKLSGADGAYVRTPKEEIAEYGVSWLPADTGKDITLAKKVLESCEHHAGLVQGRSGLGIRASKANIAGIKSQQGQDATPCYCVRGLPPAMSRQELEELLKHLGWKARPEDDGRKMIRGGASWRVRAENPPNKFSASLNYGYLRCNVQIQELGAESKVSEPEMHGTIFPAPKSWAEAVAPKVVRPTPLTKTEKAEARGSEATGEEAEPDNKKRRTQLRPFAASPAPVTPPAGPAASTGLQHRMLEMETKQHSIDLQLAALMKMMQKLTVAMGHGNEEEEAMPGSEAAPARADDSISIDSSDA